MGPTLAKELSRRGIDAVAALDVGRAGKAIEDPDQLAFAVKEVRVVVTQDRGFVRMPPHYGIIMMPSDIGFGVYVSYVELVAQVYTEDEMSDCVLYYER